MALGLYISVPFCRTKCSYCNFASDVFSNLVFERYVDRVCADLTHAAETILAIGGQAERVLDSIYLGGGTPTILSIPQLERIFVTISQNFTIAPSAEVTVECAPGTITDLVVQTLVRSGVNRVSLGVQSFVDREAASVGRLHKRETVLQEIERLREAGVGNINIDLIAGLPHQDAQSWQFSLNEVIRTGVPHASVYMLEIDEDSRLGRELMAGGTKYHAHYVPDDDLTADLYQGACDSLSAAGVRQYEISNFSRQSYESRHNLKYWTRQPYFGVGVDAHSMLPTECGAAVRFSTPDVLEKYIAGDTLVPKLISAQAALEEAFFLGLRLNAGVDLGEISDEFGADAVSRFVGPITEMTSLGLLEHHGRRVCLTARGRLLSNEVFERFISQPELA